MQVRPSKNESFGEDETERRREAALKRMLSTPPQPHKKTTGERKSQRGKTKGRPVKPKSIAI
jgi:hypothetical protein